MEIIYAPCKNTLLYIRYLKRTTKSNDQTLKKVKCGLFKNERIQVLVAIPDY